MDNAEALMKFTVGAALERCAPDLKFCDQFYGDKVLVERLTGIAGDEPFLRLKYADAVELLAAEIAKDPSKWQFPDVEFGTDLATDRAGTKRHGAFKSGPRRGHVEGDRGC